MTANRLRSLAILKINRARCEHLQHSSSKLGEMVQTFKQLNPRKMKLPFMLQDSDDGGQESTHGDHESTE